MGGRGQPVWKNRKIFPLPAKELDEETGYYYFGARYYDPKVSMWISTDPAIGKYLPTADQLFYPEDKFDFRSMPGIGGVYNSVNLNVYHYAGQNPIKYSDSDGKFFFLPALPAIIKGTIIIGGIIITAIAVEQIKKNLPEGRVELGTPTHISIPKEKDLQGIDSGKTKSATDNVFKAEEKKAEGKEQDAKEGSQDKPLTKGDIRRLKDGNVDPEKLKGGKRTGNRDLFKDKAGNIKIKPKSGKGPGEPTGLNIKDFY